MSEISDNAIASYGEYLREHNANRNKCIKCEGYMNRSWARDNSNRIECCTEDIVGCGMKSALIESKCQDCQFTIHYWQECS